VKAVKKVIDERVALPSVVVDPSLSQDAVPSNVALRSDSDGQMLPSIVVDPTFEAVMAARELPTAESIATSRSGARWDSRGVAVKALLALAAVLLLGAALSRLG